MNHSFKRFLSILLCIGMIMGNSGIHAYAEGELPGGDGTDYEQTNPVQNPIKDEYPVNNQPEANQQDNDNQPADDQQGNDNQPANNQQGEENQPAENQQGEENQPAENQQGEENQPAENQQGEENQPAENQQGEENQPAENQQGEENQPAENQQGEENQPAEDQQDEENQPAENQQGEENQPADNQQAEENQPDDERQDGEQKPAEEAVPFSFQTYIGSVSITVTAVPGVFAAGAQLSVSALGNNEISQAAEKALQVNTDERTFIKHRLYSFSGAEMNGEAQVLMTGLDFTDLMAQYPDGELSVYLLRWNGTEKTVARVSADVIKEYNKLSFTLSSPELYDLITVIRLPEQPAYPASEEQLTEETVANAIRLADSSEISEGNEIPKSNKNLEESENAESNDIPEGNENPEVAGGISDNQQPPDDQQPTEEQQSAEKEDPPTVEQQHADEQHPTDEQPMVEEPEPEPFKQITTVGNVRVTITADASVFAPDANVNIEQVNSQALCQLAEQALGIAGESHTIVFHYIFRISGAEMDGSGKVKLERLLLSDLAALHQDGEPAVYALRFDASEQQAQETKCNYSIEKNGAAFLLSGMGIYDVVFVIRKPAPAPVEALEVDDASQDNEEVADTEETVTSVEPDEKEEPTESEEPNDGEKPGDEPQAEDGEQPETESPAPFIASGENSSGVVTVTAAAGVFPAGVKLTVSDPVPTRGMKKSADPSSTAEQVIVSSYSYEISVTDADGNPVQPAKGTSATLSFQLKEADDPNLTPRVLHEGTAIPCHAVDGAVIADTNGFSKYTVEFYYNKKDYVLPGDSSIALSEILGAVGLTGEVMDAQVSNASLFSVSKESGTWTLTAHKAFSTTEWMTIIINGVTYEITVTDSSIVNSGACGDNLTWSLTDDGALTISGEGQMDNFDPYSAPWGTEPTSVNIESGVTSIGDWAFFACDSLTDITIPNGVTSIGDCSFSSCTNLTGITIPNGVTSIGYAAFVSCSSLVDITIPSSVTSIGNSAFSGCTSLTDITIPSGVSTIGEDVFSNCTSLTGVTIPNSVTSIGNSAFYNCTELFSITIPSGVTSIGDSAFSDCTSLTDITIPSSVTSIGTGAFSGCSGLTYVTILNGVTSIGDYAFYNCTSLTDVVIPDGVTSINSSTFCNCSSLTSMTIPESVTSIGVNALSLLDTLTTIYFGGTQAQWASISVSNGNESIANATVYYNDPVYSKGGFCGINLTWTLKTDGTLTISGTGAMNDYYTSTPWERELTQVIISSGVTSIGYGAFANCPDSLTSVTIPPSVTTIEYGAFSYDYGFTDVYYSGTEDEWAAITIGSENEPLTNATIHFSSSASTFTVTFDANGGSGTMDAVSVDNGASYTLPACSFTAPEGKTFKEWSVQIGNAAAVVKAPDDEITVTADTTVTAIWCYSGTWGDLTWTLDENGLLTISGIGNMNPLNYKTDAWHLYRDSIISIKIIEGVTSIGDYAFQYCSNLLSVTMPSGINSVGIRAFSDCNSLESISIPFGVKDICNYAFAGCSSLTNITIPSSVTSIGTDAFRQCSGLSSITIPSIVSSIGSYTFVGCYGLTSVTIPKSVTNIGEWAFSGCTGLNDVYYSGTQAQWNEITIAPLGNDPLTTATLHTTEIYQYGTWGSLTWTLDENGLLTISGNGAMDALYSTDAWRVYSSDIQNVVIESGVTSIGNTAFAYCTSLATVVIPSSVTRIGDYAFEYCSSLSNVVIPDSVTYIGNSSFNNCTGLENISIGNSVTAILYRTFYNCTSLMSVTLPDSVTDIVVSAFGNCIGLTSVTIPSSVILIRNNAFSGCTNLANVYFGGTQAQWDAIDISETTGNESLTTATIHFCSTASAFIVTFDANGGTGTMDAVSADNGASYTLPACAFTAPEGKQFKEWSVKIGENESVSKQPDDEITVTADTTVTAVWEGIVASGECGANGNNLTWTLTDDGVLTICGTGDMRNYYFTNENNLFSALSGITTAPWGAAPSSVVVDPGVTNISDYAFIGCSNLVDISIPNSVTSIGAYAFCGCNKLPSIVISDSVSSIWASAFVNCSSLIDLTIPESVTTIGIDAFYGCNSLHEIHISSIESWLSINYLSYSSHPNTNGTCHLYLNNEELTNITIPNSITSICDYAFYRCTGLTSVTIPNSVTNIGDSAFLNCNSLTDIYYGGTEDAWTQLVDGKTLGIPSTTTIHYTLCVSFAAGEGTGTMDPVSVDSGTDYTLPACGFTAPEGKSFKEWSVKIGENDAVAMVPDSTFTVTADTIVTAVWEDIVASDIIASGECGANGNNLTWTLNSAGTLIISGTGAMYGYGTNYLNGNFITTAPWGITPTSAVIEDGVTSIGNCAFSGCSDLTSVAIPDSVTSIGASAFSGCNGLNEIHISSIESWLTINYWNDSSHPNNNAVSCRLYLGDTELTRVTIPDSLTSISSYAFHGCNDLTSVTIPDGVTSIDEQAFYGCTGLTSMTIPDGVTSIGFAAFYGCISLTSVTIPDSVTSIGNNVFFGCTSLTSVTIPDGVTSIDEQAFYGCTGLTNVTIPDGVTSIGFAAFYGCIGLTSVTIPDGVISIDYGGFSRCTSLTSITISDSVTSIGGSAFLGCNSLTDVYYGGTETAWTQLVGDKDLGIPSTATIHYALCVSFAAGEGSGTMDDVTVYSGTTYTLPACGFTAPEGKTFKEWSVKIGEAEAIAKAPDDEITVTANTTITAVWQDEIYAGITTATATFDDMIKLNFYINVPEEIREGAYAILTCGGSTVRIAVNQAPYFADKGYRFSYALVAKQIEDNVNIRLYDAEDQALPLKNAAGTNDYTATGIDFTLLRYVDYMIESGTNVEMRDLAQAAKDYCYAAKQRFSGGNCTISNAVNAVSAGQLSAYAGQMSGTLPAGVTIDFITALFESDNSFRLYLAGDNNVLNGLTYKLDDTIELTLQTRASDGKRYLTFTGVKSNQLQNAHTFTISDGTNTYSVTVSVLTYARAVLINNGTAEMQVLAKSLYLYNLAAIAKFGSN